MGVSFDASEVQEGIKQLEQNLPNILEKALEKACLIVENSAKQNCPVDDGQLRQSITHTVEGTRAEVGTGIYSTEGNGRQTPWSYEDANGEWHTTEGMVAQPFLKPALEENKGRIIECFKELI